ncbi:MAG: repressor LexA, partial [Chloroflexi bacterium]|nr:repressor LexA [Chloroflexota bacterium]
MPLSQRQKEIVRFIEDFTRRHGYPPSIREIGQAVGISSTSVVNYNLNILQREGFIRRDREVSRGIRLVDATASDYLVSIPLLGRIAAGQPLPVPDENPSLDTIELTRNLVREEEGIYALEVRGDSMIDALINDGD